MVKKEMKKKPRKGSVPKQPELKLGADKEKNLSFVKAGSKEEADIKADLVRKMDALIVDFEKTNLNEFSKSSKAIYSETQYDKTNEYNRLFAQQMLLNFAGGFLQADSASSMVNIMGSYFAFAMMSDIGRHPFKHIFGNKEPIKARLYKENPTYAEQVENAMGNDSQRLPMSAECASLLYIKATKQAYEDMRKPGANALDVKHEYDSYLKYLSLRCEQDGISREALHRTVKQVYALFDDDDNYGSRKLFEQTAGTFGVVEKPYSMNVANVDENGKMNMTMAHIHMGEYIYPDNMVSRPNGYFNIRMPKSESDYDKLMMGDAVYLYMLNISRKANNCEGMKDLYEQELDRIVDNYAVMMRDDRVFDKDMSVEEARTRVYGKLRDNLEACVTVYKDMPKDKYDEITDRIKSSAAKHTTEVNGKQIIDTNGLMSDIRMESYNTFKAMYPEMSPEIDEEKAMASLMGQQQPKSSMANKSAYNPAIAKGRFEKFGYPQGSREAARVEVARFGEDVRPIKKQESEPMEASETPSGSDYDEELGEDGARIDDLDYSEYY